MYTKLLFPRAWSAAALATVLGAFAGSAMADPPDRVARVGFLRGEVSFQTAGDDRWAEASLNRPMGTGDKVYTDRDSRVELEIGAAAVRLDEHSTFNLLNLDDQIAQMELTEGAADEVSTCVCDSMRYFAYVAAWSELPRAQVTTARGGSLRSFSPSSRSSDALWVSCAPTSCGASAASRYIRVWALTMMR
jgi:hypothetical protein